MANPAPETSTPQVARGGRTTRASALIVTMGVLTILAVLAFVFASVAKGERKISRTYVDQVRAKIYAMSGIESAVSRIQQYVSSPPAGGGDATFSIAEGSNVPWNYVGSRNRGSLTPVEDAPLCSFQSDYLPLRGDYYNADALGPAGNIANPNNTIIGVTSYFPGTYFGRDFTVVLPAPPPGSAAYPLSFPEGASPPAATFLPNRFRTGDVVSVRVVDTGGQFYLNGPDPTGVPNPGGGPPTTLSNAWVSLLNRLGQVLQQNSFPAPPGGLGLPAIPAIRCSHGVQLSASGANIGTRVAAIRNALGRNILMKGDMQRPTQTNIFYDSTPGSAGFHDFEIVSQFLSAHAWVDTTTLDPSKLQHMRANDPTIFYTSSGSGILASRPDYGPPEPGLDGDVNRLARAALTTIDPSEGDPLVGASAPSDLAVSTLAAVGASPSASCAVDRLVNQRRSQSGYHPTGNDHFGPQQTCQGNALSSAPSYPPANDCLQPRAPLNLNSASYCALRSNIEGVAGVFWDRLDWSSPSAYNASPCGNYEGPGYTNAQREVLSPLLAHFVACHIIAKRERRGPYAWPGATPPTSGPGSEAWYLLPGEPGYVLPGANFPGGPFRTWLEWYKFVDFVSTQPGNPFSGNAARRGAQKGILKANANPNSHINKFNPDECFGARFGDVDKADLDTWSTEFSFRSNGYFEVDSVGRVLENQGQTMPPTLVIVAEQKVSTIIRVYDVVKHSTQKQFISRRLDSLNTQTYPENINPVSNVTGNPAAWGTITSPVPAVQDKAADWDGFIGVADADYGGELIVPSGMYQHYTSSLGTAVQGTAEDGRSVVDGAGLPNPNTLGPQSELFTDGFFAHEVRRYPGATLSANRVYGWGNGSVGEPMEEYIRYPVSGSTLNVTTNGTVEMWVKPTWTAKDFYSGNYGHNCPTDPSFDVGTVGHTHPMGESTRCFASYGDCEINGQGHSTGAQRLVLAAQRIGYSPKQYLGNLAPPGGNDGNPGVFFISARKGNCTEDWLGNGTPSGNYYWNDAVPQWGKFFLNVYAPPVQPNTSDPRSWGNAGRWHHVALSWQGTTSWIHVDGVYNLSGRIGATRVQNPGGNASLFIGSNRFMLNDSNGHPCDADATIDGVRTWTTVAYGQSTINPVPPRYKTTAMSPVPPFYRGRMLIGGAGPGSEIARLGPGRIVNVSWTGWFPNYNTETAVVTFSATNGSTNYILPSATTASQGKGTPIDPALDLNPTVAGNLDYQFTMNLTGSFVPATPYVDDVTFTFIPSKIRYLYYFFQ